MLVSYYCKYLLLILGRNLNLYTSLHVARNTEIAARVRVSTPDCRLEVSTHSEGPATDQLEPGFLWVSSVMGSYPKSTLNCTLLLQPPKKDQNFVIILHYKHKFEPKLLTCILSCRLHKVHFPSPDLYYQTLYLFYGLPLPEGRAGTASEPSKQRRFRTPLLTLYPFLLIFPFYRP